jgi:hypothetical protein
MHPNGSCKDEELKILNCPRDINGISNYYSKIENSQGYRNKLKKMYYEQKNME